MNFINQHPKEITILFVCLSALLIILFFAFRNAITDKLFEWIEPHPDKAVYNKYLKIGKSIPMAYSRQSLLSIRLKIDEFERMYAKNYNGIYYTRQLREAFKKRSLQLSIEA